MWSLRQFRKSWNIFQALRRERDGVAAIEFGLIALPFFYLLFAIRRVNYFAPRFYAVAVSADGFAGGANESDQLFRSNATRLHR